MGVYYIGSVPCSGGDIYHYGRKGMKWGKNIFGKISEFFTGNNTRRELSSARTALRGAQQKSRHFDGKDINGNYTFDVRRDYNNPINISGRTFYPFEETGKRWSPEINRQNDRLNKAQAAYDKTLPGMMAKAREKVSTAYADAAAAIGNKGLDIQSFYSQVMQKAQGAINQGKNMVSKYGGQFVSQIQTLGNNALAGGKSFLEGIMKKAKQAKSKATEPISRFKAREAEKRDAEYDVGHKSNHDRNLGRERNYDKYNRGSGLGPYTPHRDAVIEYYDSYSGAQKSQPVDDDNGNLIGGYKRSKGKPGNKVLDKRVSERYRTSRQAYKAVDKKIKKK